MSRMCYLCLACFGVLTSNTHTHAAPYAWKRQGKKKTYQTRLILSLTNLYFATQLYYPCILLHFHINVSPDFTEPGNGVFFFPIPNFLWDDQKNPLCGVGGFSCQSLQEAAKNLINTAFSDGLNFPPWYVWGENSILVISLTVCG